MQSQSSRPIMAQLGADLKRERSSRGLSLRDVAEMTGVGVSTLSRLERGTCVPDLGTVDRVAQFLGQTVVVGTGDTREHTALTTPDLVLSVLAVDPGLSTAHVKMIDTIVRSLYAAYTWEKKL